MKHQRGLLQKLLTPHGQTLGRFLRVTRAAFTILNENELKRWRKPAGEEQNQIGEKKIRTVMALIP